MMNSHQTSDRNQHDDPPQRHSSSQPRPGASAIPGPRRHSNAGTRLRRLRETWLRSPRGRSSSETPSYLFCSTSQIGGQCSTQWRKRTSTSVGSSRALAHLVADRSKRRHGRPRRDANSLRLLMIGRLEDIRTAVATRHDPLAKCRSAGSKVSGGANRTGCDLCPRWPPRHIRRDNCGHDLALSLIEAHGGDMALLVAKRLVVVAQRQGGKS